MFVISSSKTVSRLQYEDSEFYIKSIGDFTLCFEKSKTKESGSLLLYIDGYTLSRGSQPQILDQEEILGKYRSEGSDFIHSLKGIFTLILVDTNTNEIRLFTDQLGISSVFYRKSIEITEIVSNVKLFSFKMQLSYEAIFVKSYFNRTLGNLTNFNDVFKTTCGTTATIENNVLSIDNYWIPDYLLSDNRENTLNIDDIFGLLQKNFKTFQKTADSKHLITLTGGKDSRTGLSILLNNKSQVAGFTYGNNNSRDAVFASKLAYESNIPHHVFDPPYSKEWYDKATHKIVDTGNPEISLHRAHRDFSFHEMSKLYPEKSIYYAGYMAGELLMGIYYDNLVFSKYLTEFWESNSLKKTDEFLEKRFVKNVQNTRGLSNLLSGLNTFDTHLSKNLKHFYSIFEIGIPHHSQDIFLSQKYFDYVYPFFLDIDFIEAIFNSKYSFFNVDNKSKNLFRRYNLYRFNLKIQHHFAPQLDHIPFGKKGSYTTAEYLRGPFYWTFIKGLRYFFEKKHYPVSYNYGKEYRQFLLEKLLLLNKNKSHELHDYFDINKAIDSLEKETGYSNEERMLKYTNIIQLFLQLENYNNEVQ